MVRSSTLAGHEFATSDNFRAGFKILSFSQPVYSLFAADEGTNPETAGRIYMFFFFLKIMFTLKQKSSNT